MDRDQLSELTVRNTAVPYSYREALYKEDPYKTPMLARPKIAPTPMA